MSVWLTPELKPFVGGTYFPPDDRYYGRPGFKSMLENIHAAVSKGLQARGNIEYQFLKCIKIKYIQTKKPEILQFCILLILCISGLLSGLILKNRDK